MDKSVEYRIRCLCILKVNYDKDGNLIQREMNGLFAKCTSKLIINLKKWKQIPHIISYKKKELPHILKT